MMKQQMQMNAQHSTLLVRPLPFRNEGPRGYMLRLAEANWLTFKELQSIGFTYDYQTLQHEALLPALEIDPALHQQVALYTKLLHTQTRSVWNHRYPRFCPHCLNEDIFWRVEWEILFYDACVTHNTWLIDQCTSCGNKLTWNRDSVVRCDCGADLRTEFAIGCPESIIRLSEVLKNKINQSPPNIGYPAPFSKTDVEQTQRIISYLASYMKENSGKNPLKIKQAGTMNRSWPITSFSAQLLNDWPQAFHTSLTTIQSKSEVSKPTLSNLFGRAYHYLYRGLTGEAFNEIRAEFEFWLSESWRGGLAKRNKRLTALVLDKAKWVPGNLACDTLGISIGRLKRLIQEGVIEGECHISDKQREFVMVQRDSIELIRHNLAGEIDMVTARTLLGLGKKRTQQLLRLIFPMARKSGTSSSSPWTVSRFEVNQLLDIAEDIPKLCIPDEGCVSLNHILRYWAWSAEDIVNLVNAVRTSELKPVNILENVVGISGWVFQENTLKAWREKSVQGLGTWLTIEQTAKLIGIHQQAAYNLVNMHFIKSELIHGQPKGGKRVRRTDVEKFAKNYIFATEVGQRLAVSARMAISILNKQFIKPVSGPGIDDGRQVLFLRTDALERIFIEVKNEEQFPMELK